MIWLQLSFEKIFFWGGWRGGEYGMSKQKKFENNTDYIPPEVSLNYLKEVNGMKSTYQYTLDTIRLQIHRHNSDIIGIK